MSRFAILLSCAMSIGLAGLSGCGKKDDNPAPGPGPGPGPGNSVQPVTLSPRTSVSPQVKKTGSDEMRPSVQTIAVTADGDLVLCQGTGKAKNAQLWDIAKNQKLHEFDNEAIGFLPVAFSPDGKTLAFSSNYRVHLRDVAQGTELRKLERNNGGFAFVEGLFYSPKGDLIVSSTGNVKQIIGWDPTTGEKQFEWKEDEEITDLSRLFDEGKKIAAGRKDGVVRVWDMATGKPIQTLKGEHTKQVLALAPTADGKLLASAAYEEPIKVWDLATGKVIRSIQTGGSLTRVNDMVFLPNGATLVYSPGDKTIVAEDVRTGTRRAILKGHTGEVWSLALTPDGATLVSAADDGTFKVWDLKGLP